MGYVLSDSHHLKSQHRKLVARIGLLVSVASCAILLATLMLITDDAGERYSAIIYSHSLTRYQLGPAMLFAALVLVAIAGFATWFVALYSSFRIAGPLYRFTQNFKVATANISSAKILPIRKGDAVQDQATAVMQAIAGLRDHYAAMKDAAQEASSALAAGDDARYTDAMTRLRSLDEKARI